jgi:hypothetical protein
MFGRVATHGISCLSSADCNKSKLGAAGVIPLLIRVLSETGDWLSQRKLSSVDGAWARENATSALWALAFDASNLACMLESKRLLTDELNRIVDAATTIVMDSDTPARDKSILRAARSATNLCFKLDLEDTSDEVTGRATWNRLRSVSQRSLGGSSMGDDEDSQLSPSSTPWAEVGAAAAQRRRRRPQQQQQQQNGEGGRKELQFLFSYFRGDGKSCALVKDELRKRGHRICMFDSQEQTLDSVTQMQEMVNASDAVLVGLSPGYKKSKACRTEFGKNLLPSPPLPSPPPPPRVPPAVTVCLSRHRAAPRRMLFRVQQFDCRQACGSVDDGSRIRARRLVGHASARSGVAQLL